MLLMKKYEGNEKSHRAQEKCGFRYHHTERDREVPALNERWTEHDTRLRREDWRADLPPAAAQEERAEPVTLCGDDAGEN